MVQPNKRKNRRNENELSQEDWNEILEELKRRYSEYGEKKENNQ